QGRIGTRSGDHCSPVGALRRFGESGGSADNARAILRSVASPSPTPEHMYDEGMKVHVYSNAGVVSGVYRETGMAKGKPYTRRARFTDTWIKQNGQWKCVASQSTLVQ